MNGSSRCTNLHILLYYIWTIHKLHLADISRDSLGNKVWKIIIYYYYLHLIFTPDIFGTHQMTAGPIKYPTLVFLQISVVQIFQTILRISNFLQRILRTVPSATMIIGTTFTLLNCFHTSWFDSPHWKSQHLLFSHVIWFDKVICLTNKIRILNESF